MRAYPPSVKPIPAVAGIGLRFPHHREVLEQHPTIGWMEVHPENYLDGGKPLAELSDIRRDYPISLHAVGLSLGSVDGIDRHHLHRLAELQRRVQPGLFSDHLSWSVAGGTYLADLLPLPMTEEALAAVCRNVDIAQEQLGRILVENPSSYVRYHHSTIPEHEFLATVAARTGCGILCDVNNVFVSSRNHSFDAASYLAALPADAVGEIHLAGHTLRDLGGGRHIRIDDHASLVCDDVWQLFRLAIARFGRVPALIEWDNDIPPLATLLAEAAKADCILAESDADAIAA